MQIRVARNARKLMFASLSQKEKRHMQPYASVMQGRFIIKHPRFVETDICGDNIQGSKYRP